MFSKAAGERRFVCLCSQAGDSFTGTFLSAGIITSAIATRKEIPENGLSF
jgi:hypothetical protein